MRKIRRMMERSTVEGSKDYVGNQALDMTWGLCTGTQIAPDTVLGGEGV